MKEQCSRHPKENAASVFLCTDNAATPQEHVPVKPSSSSKPKSYCPFCNNKEPYLNSYLELKKLNTSKVQKWIQEGDRCWKCGRNHKVTACFLKRPRKTYKELYLTVMHEAIQETSQKVLMVSSSGPKVYFDQPRHPQKAMLKVIKDLLHHGDCTLEVVFPYVSEKTVSYSKHDQHSLCTGKR